MLNKEATASASATATATAPVVKVYILLGQSNMLGMGKVEGSDEGSLEQAVKEQHLYPYLLDVDGNWDVSDQVRNVRVMASGIGPMKNCCNNWMTAKGCKTIGPELGIGHALEKAANNDNDRILLLKSCIGNRSLGWDLLPPGSEAFEYSDRKGVTWIHPGYKGSPEQWKKGTEPKPINWYAGMQYDGDIRNAKEILTNLDTYYPGATDYEVAGFFWWQGDKDSRSDALAARYELNLAHLIRQLREEFDAPNAKFVCATLGQTVVGAKGNEGKLLDAMCAVGHSNTKYEDFIGNVATVYSHPFSKGGSSGGHYNKNAMTYMNVGEAMGQTMVELEENS